MTAASNGATTLVRPATKQNKTWVNFKKYWMLHAMMVLPMLYYAIFEFLPLYGVQIAFRDYSAADGIFNSPWLGLKHYIDFFSDWEWTHFVVNTITVSLYSICVGFPIPVILALLIHINQKKVLKKLTQNVSYIPHFISIVVMIGLLNQILHPTFGLLGSLMKAFGVYNVPDIRFLETSFRHLYVWSGVWQNMGWSTIVYVAALSGVSAELHEAAKIDGASRWRRVLSVDLPAIMPTVSIMLIMRFGSIMSVGYEKVYLMQQTQNLDVSEILSTHIYKVGLMGGKNSYGTAVGLLNSVINTIMIVAVNLVTSWLTDGEQGLF